MAENIFINHKEHRLRALWRIILQGVIFLGGNVLTSIILGIVLGIILLTSGGNVQNAQDINKLAGLPISRIIMYGGTLLFALLSYWIAGRWLDHRPLKAFGFHFSPRWWTDFAFGLALGALLMVFIFLFERAAGWVTVTGKLQSSQPGVSFWTGIAVSLFGFFCVGIYEEMLSRGYQLRNLAEGLNFKPLNPRLALLLAYLISSSIFGMLHLANPNASLVSTLNLIVAGLFLGLGYVLTGELAISIGLHMTWNFFQGNVFGFPVSGGETGASFIAIRQGGPTLWTGGAFGPEAGLTGLAAILLGCLLIVLWVRWQYGRISLKDSLAVYSPDQPAAAIKPADQGQPAQPGLETPGD